MYRCICMTLFAAMVVTAAQAGAAPLTVELPQETAAFKPGPGSEIANVQCLICHSVEYISTQPPTSARGYWKATVEKMKHKFGASIPDEQIVPLVDYLVSNYGSEQAKK